MAKFKTLKHFYGWDSPANCVLAKTKDNRISCFSLTTYKSNLLSLSSQALLATTSAPWGTRMNNAGNVYGNKMWVIGGFNVNTNTTYEDIWYSSDGINWTELTSEALWGKRYGACSVVYDNKLWIIGGSSNSGLTNDVWYME